MQLSHIMYRPLTPLRLCFYSAWTQMDMLSTYKIRESPRSVCLIAFLKKKSVFHGVAAGNDATFTFNLDSWWKHHLDLNYPARFFFFFPFLFLFAAERLQVTPHWFFPFTKGSSGWCQEQDTTQALSLYTEHPHNSLYSAHAIKLFGRRWKGTNGTR